MQVVDPDEAFDPDKEEPEEVALDSSVLEHAVRQSMSIWRSHDTTGERWKYSTEDDDDEDDDVDDEDDESECEAEDRHGSAAATTANGDDDDEWSYDDVTASGNSTQVVGFRKNNLSEFFRKNSAKIPEIFQKNS